MGREMDIDAYTQKVKSSYEALHDAIEGGIKDEGLLSDLLAMKDTGVMFTSALEDLREMNRPNQDSGKQKMANLIDEYVEMVSELIAEVSEG